MSVEKSARKCVNFFKSLPNTFGIISLIGTFIFNSSSNKNFSLNVTYNFSLSNSIPTISFSIINTLLVFSFIFTFAFFGVFFIFFSILFTTSSKLGNM